ncbi:hypothetical protein GCM10009541_50550 [Micromonospora gifhornensis]|uniref:Uncharacterized protein n=1 Tax=Micromonospora gifhornensis TaxID=84594 RepID=A0ABQ4I793_9ACTN|nr:hypothetical protein Vgi01_04530 [Micromonospora gifhornensis]
MRMLGATDQVRDLLGHHLRATAGPPQHHLVQHHNCGLVVQDKHGLHDRGCSARAAAQLDQNFQVLSVAIARSPRVRIFAWARFTAFCRRDSFGRKRCRLNGVRTLLGAP